MHHHIVRAGDSLYSIAMHHCTTVRHLIDLNSHIRNPHRIYPGERIKVGDAKHCSHKHVGQHETSHYQGHQVTTKHASTHHRHDSNQYVASHEYPYQQLHSNQYAESYQSPHQQLQVNQFAESYQSPYQQNFGDQFSECYESPCHQNLGNQFTGCYGF